MGRAWRWMVGLTAAACSSAQVDDLPAGETADTGSRPALGEPGAPAALATPSVACPDLSTPGLTTIKAGGSTRDVGIYFPSSRPEGMPIMFVWHGLSPDGAQIPVIESFVGGFDLDRLAESNDTIVVVPAAPTQDILGQRFLLWGVLDEAGKDVDLELYDDLRACLVSELGADPWQVSSWGFSGGALWQAVLIMDRADTLAAAGSASGGTDEALTPQAAYRTPSADVPVMLIDGGSSDTWPGGGLDLLDFQRATSAFRDELIGDGHLVASCEHSFGHTLPSSQFKAMRKFLRSHVYGDPSPYAAPDQDLLDDSCTLAVP